MFEYSFFMGYSFSLIIKPKIILLLNQETFFLQYSSEKEKIQYSIFYVLNSLTQNLERKIKTNIHRDASICDIS